ncbi:MAG: hypothetical protein JO032_16905 [Alphaproteobacteria bacterium]|nr:hypothetical protein [Alphaproteobacteria bacterium]MBV9554462.1 hypothetical protein [Alphaproteobacteria bacterium]
MADILQENGTTMTQIGIASRTEIEIAPALLSELDELIDRQIRTFLNGDSDGEEVLEALYGDVEAEAIPQRLLTTLRR